MGRKTYSPISSFWVLLVPAVLFALGYYAYSEPGYVGMKVRAALGPIVNPVLRELHRIF